MGRKAPKSLIDKVYAIATAKMENMGFYKKADRFFILPTSKASFWGTITLSRSVEQGDRLLRIIPQIGIGCSDLRKLFHELLGDGCRSYAPHIIKQLGYLMPRRSYYAWSFTENCNCSEQIEKMMEAIRKYAVPFILKNSNLIAIYRKASTMEYNTFYNCEITYPLSLQLLGRFNEARMFLFKRMTEIVHEEAIKGVVSDYQKNFRSFGVRYFKQFSTNADVHLFQEAIRKTSRTRTKNDDIYERELNKLFSNLTKGERN